MVVPREIFPPKDARALGHVGNIACFVVDGGAREFTEPGFHKSANLEFDRSLLRYFNRFKRLGILRFAGLAKLGFKHPEIPEFQTIPRAQFTDDLVEKLLNHPLDLNAALIRRFRDSVDQLFLGDRGHDCILESV